MKQLMLVLVFSMTMISRADADDIAAYALSSRQEVAATKQKLKNKDGIFNDFNYRGTILREAKPEDRAPASAEVEVDESTGGE